MIVNFLVDCGLVSESNQDNDLDSKFSSPSFRLESRFGFHKVEADSQSCSKRARHIWRSVYKNRISSHASIPVCHKDMARSSPSVVVFGIIS